MQTLGSDRVMIAPDYPGLGQSDPPPSMPDMAGYTGAMAEALEALGFGAEGNRGAVDVCANHTGAMIAIELAVTRPDLVRRLVLMGIPYYDAEERRRQYEKNVVEKSIPGELSGLQGSWDFAVTHREKGVLLERGYETFVDVLKAGNRRHWAYHAVFTYPAEQRAPLVRQPVLILNTHGSLEKETRAMAPYFKQVQLVEIPELHRGIFDVGPDLLAGHAKAFLDQP
jgi:pimeloyl-ACP methyl ester carboxylesterase